MIKEQLVHSLINFIADFEHMRVASVNSFGSNFSKCGNLK